MNRCTIIFFVLIGSAILAGCFGEDEKTKAPKKDYVIVKNDGVENFKVTLQNRVKDKVLIPFNETVKIEFLSTKTKTVFCLLYTSDAADE